VAWSIIETHQFQEFRSQEFRIWKIGICGFEDRSIRACAKSRNPPIGKFLKSQFLKSSIPEILKSPGPAKI
jgi:hypothetical protein